ncbi:hypothetical protein ACFE04_018211 [Oxalis oulophora]
MPPIHKILFLHSFLVFASVLTHSRNPDLGVTKLGNVATNFTLGFSASSEVGGARNVIGARNIPFLNSTGTTDTSGDFQVGTNNTDDPNVNDGLWENTINIDYPGKWELFSKDSGVSAMHSILLPNNQVVMYDATIWEISRIKLPKGVPCRHIGPGNDDCWSHAVFFDIETGKKTPLKLDSDTWCSSGALDVNGNLVGTGGDRNGSWTVRFLDANVKANWREYVFTLKDARWYATTVTLSDGRFVIFGGRDVFTYEFIPPEGQKSPKSFPLQLLKDTRDSVENNLYPFVFMSTDGNLFIFANDRSILFDAAHNKVIKQFPVLAGGARSYPATGNAVLLPIRIKGAKLQKGVIPAEVMVCGGSTHDAFFLAETKKQFAPALADCNRLRITEDNPQWEKEDMPSPRVMGDMIILPDGSVVILNGAKKGSAGWGDADEPNYEAVLYTPGNLPGNRFKTLAASKIPRMYHSSAVLLPDGKVLVAGSNSNNGYLYKVKYPTELRVEKFWPPYLDPALDKKRPEIVPAQTATKLRYDMVFGVRIKLNVDSLTKNLMKVTMYPPAFCTHGVTMDQRLVILGVKDVKKNDDGTYDLMVRSPPSSKVGPQGYYMLFAVYQGIPGKSIWVQIK